MENSLKISQQEVEDELPSKQQKVEEQQGKDDNSEKEHPAHENFLKPQLAFEIFTALPIAHQRRLLPLWRSIYQDHPIPDEWTRWKIFEWSGNGWNPTITAERLQISNDGLSFNMDNMASGNRTGYFVAANNLAEFLPTQIDGPQICYYEAKHIRGHYLIGFSTRGQPNFFGIKETGQYQHILHNECTRHSLPNVAPILNREITTIGCGLFKHLGKLKIFFTKNGQLLAKPILLPSTTQNEFYPVIFLCSAHCQFEDTNFGLKPFQFKYKGNEEKLLEEMTFE